MATPPSPAGEGPGVDDRARALHTPEAPRPASAPQAPGPADAGDSRPVTVAAIAGAHGVAGEVRLKLFGEGVAALRRYRAFNAGALTLSGLRDDGKGGAIARFAEVATRTAAEGLRGTALSVPRSALPPLAPGEYYHADLVGLPAVSTAGEALGECVAVENFGAGDVIEIRRPDGRRFMVPMRAEAVPGWDDSRLLVEPAWAQD